MAKASGTPTAGLSASATPRRCSTRTPLGPSWMPAPGPPKLERCSRTTDLRPVLASASARARPPMPPPTMSTGSDIGQPCAQPASGRGGPGVRVHQATRRFCCVERQAGVVNIKCRAVRTQDLIVCAHVEVDVGMIEGRPRAHALELLDADRDFFNAAVVGEMRDEGGCHVCACRGCQVRPD